MKTFNLFFLTLLLLFSSCATTYKPTQEVVTLSEDYLDIYFKPHIIKKQITQDLFLDIKPINVQQIDSFINFISILDGDYHKEQKSVVTNHYIDEDNLSIDEKKRVKKIRFYAEEIERAAKKNIINYDAATALIERLYSDNHFNGLEYNIANKSKSLNNPFLINNKYLSVFSLEFENKSDQSKEFNLNDLVIKNGYEMLKPFSAKELEEFSKLEYNKILLLKRIYCPDKVKIPPHSKINFFFAVNPINIFYKSFDILYENVKLASYDIDVKTTSIKKDFTKYIFNGVDLSQTNALESIFYVIKIDNTYIPVKGKTFYFQELHRTVPISIYGIAITMEGRVLASKNENILLNKQIHNEIDNYFTAF